MTLAPNLFERDRFTWLAYLMLGYYAYLQTSLGPVMPFLRAELNLSYTLGGLHISAFALGMIAIGLAGDRLTRRVGRGWTFWGGAAGMGAGAILLAAGRQAMVTLGATLIMGLLGSLSLVTIQASLADRHGERRAIALTESNVVASICSALAPLAVGGLQTSGIGWRAALGLFVVAAGLVALALRRSSIPDQHSAGGAGGARLRLPAAYWAYWIVVVLCVAVEWSMMSWGADFMETVAGLPRAVASTAMSVFLGAMIVGRVAGSRLTRSVPSGVLLLVALGVATCGFPLFWLGRQPAVTLAGLFVTGLGVANLFPMVLSAATGVDARQADAASARVALGAGLAIVTAPLALGAAADRIGIQDAFVLVLVLLVVAGGAALWARRVLTRRMADVLDGSVEGT